MEHGGAARNVRVGVAGWDYPDWAGIVYPSRSRSFDRLGFLSRFVDVVEINSTFYRPANPKSAESWAARAEKRPGFTFTAKAHRDLTHDAETDVASASHDTKLGLTPLHGAGVLGAVLLQFPQSFHNTPETLERLERLAEAFEGWPTVVEVRHISWDSDEAEEWMRERGIGWCVVDQPRMGKSTAPMRARVTSGVGYLRLHGRNRKDWFRKDAGRDARYDYLYRLDQLKPVANMAVELAKTAPVVYAVQNNHFRGQAVVNALQLKHLIEAAKPEAPASLVRAYPDLADVVEETPKPLL